MDIQLIQPDELDLFVDHLIRYLPGSGRDGAPIYTPRSRSEIPERQRLLERARTAWVRSLEEPRWTRSWGMRDGERIVGHIELHGGKLRSDLHRATMGMGLARIDHR